MPDLHPGDTVRLNSGGPEMTVQAFDPMDGLWWCVWFTDKRRNLGRFAADALVVVRPAGMPTKIETSAL